MEIILFTAVLAVLIGAVIYIARPSKKKVTAPPPIPKPWPSAPPAARPRHTDHGSSWEKPRRTDDSTTIIFVPGSIDTPRAPDGDVFNGGGGTFGGAGASGSWESTPSSGGSDSGSSSSGGDSGSSGGSDSGGGSSGGD